MTWERAVVIEAAVLAWLMLRGGHAPPTPASVPSAVAATPVLAAKPRPERGAVLPGPLTATRVTVRYVGSGEAFRVRGGTGSEPYRLERVGGADPADKRVAITFDDGPSKEWTPGVLEILKREGVSAGFFLVGSRVSEHPDLVRRELAEGHVVGNHTWSHADLRRIPMNVVEREVNDAAEAIERASGRRTRLFRAPFDADPAPLTIEQLTPLKWITRGQTLAVGTNADSHDYERPGVDRIVENVMKPVRKGWAKVILFHDAGGDRSQTLAALQAVIARLRVEGYRIVPLPELLGVTPEWVNPPR